MIPKKGHPEIHTSVTDATPIGHEVPYAVCRQTPTGHGIDQVTLGASSTASASGLFRFSHLRDLICYPAVV